MFGLSGSSPLKYGQDTEYIGTWDLAILGVAENVCVSVWRHTSIFEKFNVTVLYRAKNHRRWWFHEREAPSVSEEDSSRTAKARYLPIRSKVNIITIKPSNTNMAQKGSFTCSVLFWWQRDCGVSSSEIHEQPTRVLLDLQRNLKASLRLYNNNNNNKITIPCSISQSELASNTGSYDQNGDHSLEERLCYATQSIYNKCYANSP